MEDTGNRLMPEVWSSAARASHIRSRTPRHRCLACCLLAMACWPAVRAPFPLQAAAAEVATGAEVTTVPPGVAMVPPGVAMVPPGVAMGARIRRPGYHDLHLAYGDMAVEGSLVAGRLRFFKNDLEQGIAAMVGADSVTLEPGAEADALVMRYLRGRLGIRADGQELEASLVGSGEDELDLEPVWWIIVQYQAADTVEEIHVRNTLLFEVYDDQRNVFKFVHFPDEAQRTFYFAEGESEHFVRF